jgi:hemerythrin-like domain-containing protein
MPVTIGADTQNGFDRPIGLMKDCHRRIERFLGVFEFLAALPAGSELSAQQQESLGHAMEYFEQAAPRHVADEEDSLFPRLRHYPQSKAALGDLDHLEQDHCRAQALHATANAIGRFWLELGRLSAPQRDRFSSAVHELAALYRAHIELEDARIFPLAESLLSNEETAEIGQEMADRRGLFATA